ncbi:MAG: hypothetical protein AAB383_05730 [Patescibacteria group bacterium]
MKKLLHIIFVLIVGFSLAGNTCFKSHSFFDAAYAQTSSIDVQDHETEDFEDKELVKNSHCCDESGSSVSTNRGIFKKETTNSFKQISDLSCKPAQDFPFTPNNFTTENWPPMSSQFQPDSFWLGTIVKRE